MYDTISSAITSRNLLRFSYDGGERVVEPFCYGRNRKGTELLRAYQIRGFSKSGRPVGWKLFDVQKISSLQVVDKLFDGSRPQYNPNDSAMEIIYCRV
ncbi:MAG: hypothetical protein GF311_11615 [Candidatus Lokiarchaeota archaeon]|nr:hypothetical protein [Candidatus Lokiarchaeota archaeon]